MRRQQQHTGLGDALAHPHTAALVGPQPGDASVADLTPGEREFLDQLAKGYLYKEIADRMNISIDTVRSYVRTVYEKLHVHSRAQAVARVTQR